MKQSTLSIQYTKLDPNAVIIKQDGKYFAVPEVIKNTKNKIKQTEHKNRHAPATEGEMREI